MRTVGSIPGQTFIGTLKNINEGCIIRTDTAHISPSGTAMNIIVNHRPSYSELISKFKEMKHFKDHDVSKLTDYIRRISNIRESQYVKGLADYPDLRITFINNIYQDTSFGKYLEESGGIEPGTRLDLAKLKSDFKLSKMKSLSKFLRTDSWKLCNTFIRVNRSEWNKPIYRVNFDNDNISIEDEPLVVLKSIDSNVEDRAIDVSNMICRHGDDDVELSGDDELIISYLKPLTVKGIERLFTCIIARGSKFVKLSDDIIKPSNCVLRSIWLYIAIKKGGYDKAYKLLHDTYLSCIGYSDDVVLMVILSLLMAEHIIKLDSSIIRITLRFIDHMTTLDGPDVSRIIPISHGKIHDSLRSSLGKYTYEPLRGNMGPKIDLLDLKDAIDITWRPHLIYYLPLNIIRNVGTADISTFGVFMQELASYNYRKVNHDRYVMLYTCGGYNHVRDAQESCWKHMMNLSQTLKQCDSSSFLTITYEMDDSWLAAMVGTMKTSVNSCDTISTIKPSDRAVIISVKSQFSSCDEESTPFLDREQSELSKNNAIKLLMAGIEIHPDAVPHPSFSKAVIKLSDRDNYCYMIKKEGEEPMIWGLCNEVQLYFAETDVRIDDITCADQTIDGMSKYLDEELCKLCGMFTRLEISRAIYWLYTDMTNITFPRCGSVTFSVHDIGAFMFLHQVCKLANGYIYPSGVNSFKVTSPVASVLLRNKINKYKMSVVEDVNWGNLMTSREPLSHQIRTIDMVKTNFESGKRGVMIYLKVGSGKTYIMMAFLCWLKKINHLPSKIIYTLPKSAIDTVCSEIKTFNFNIYLLYPLKQKPPKYNGVTVVKSISDVPDGVIVIVEHDHLIRCENDLISVMPNCIFINDEAHDTYNKTKRTNIALALASLSKFFINSTGTPIIDRDVTKMTTWLKLMLDYPVTRGNYLVGANEMVSDGFNVDIDVIDEIVKVDMLEYPELAEEYANTLPYCKDYGDISIRLELVNNESYSIMSCIVSAALSILCGSIDLKGMSIHRSIIQSMELCFKICIPTIVKLVRKYLDIGVFLVAYDIKQQNVFKEAIEKEIGIKPYCIKNGNTINMTPDTVKNGGPDHKVVITTKHYSAGYSLTTLGVMIRCPFPSNAGTRKQLEGRLKRIGQRNSTIRNIVVHTGWLSLMLTNHVNVNELNNMISELGRY